MDSVRRLDTAGDCGPQPARQQAQHNARQRVNDRQRRGGAAKREHIPLERGECGVTAQEPGYEKRAQIRVKQILAVEQHKQEADDERTRYVDQKRGERKAAVVMFVNAKGGEITCKRSNTAAREYEKTPNQQCSILAPGPGKLRISAQASRRAKTRVHRLQG